MKGAIARVFGNWSKKKKIVVSCVSLVVVAVLSTAIYAYNQQKHRDDTPAVVAVITPVPATSAPTPTPPTQLANVISGKLVDPSLAKTHPLAVMIENHPDARPQSGLGQADLVYEAIAEGGITRFMAVYANPNQAIRVGPVRSARTYFVDFATEINAFYAHVGGNMDALDQIKATSGFLDLDQFSVGAPTYARDFSRNVALEHTMYSSTDKLWNYATVKEGWSPTIDIQPWKFGTEAPAASRPTSEQVKVDVSGPDYSVTWQYDPTNNQYLRNMAGSPHIDANTGQQITAKNIVIETVEHNPVVTRIGEQGWHYQLTGTGKAVVINNGKATEGVWKKNGTDRTRYYDNQGNEMLFVPGTTWVHIVHPESSVSY